MTTSSEVLERLLDELVVEGADTAAIERRIWQLFGERWCVVFTDMAGFSKKSAREGIISFLVDMQQMRALVAPIVEAHNGFVLKHIADSQLILFRDPRDGLAACLAMQRAVATRNIGLPDAKRFYLGCGVGYGDLLKLGDAEVYGVEVNFAAKLGEDIAGPFEILVTDAVATAVTPLEGVAFERVEEGRLGGTNKTYLRAIYATYGDETQDAAKERRVRFR